MADMQKIREEMEYLLAQDPERKLHAHAVWAYGRDYESEIGAWMEEQGVFNPDVAQEKLGLILARQLIVRVRVTVERNEPESPLRIRQYQSVKDDRSSGGGYRRVHEIMGDDALRESLLATAKSELQALRMRYAGLQELSFVFAAIDGLDAIDSDQARSGVDGR